MITLNSDTGAVTGSFGGGTAAWTVHVDPVSKLCRWTFQGDLYIPGNTLIEVVGGSRVSLTAHRNITLGTPGGAAVMFTVVPAPTGAVAGGGGGGDGGNGGGGSPGTVPGGGGMGGAGGGKWGGPGNDGTDGSYPSTAGRSKGYAGSDGSAGAGS
ncbi:MAG: hypothetical protein ACYS5V_15645, partial [Planctomycetota bacterium]